LFHFTLMTLLRGVTLLALCALCLNLVAVFDDHSGSIIFASPHEIEVKKFQPRGKLLLGEITMLLYVV